MILAQENNNHHIIKLCVSWVLPRLPVYCGIDRLCSLKECHKLKRSLYMWSCCSPGSGLFLNIWLVVQEDQPRLVLEWPPAHLHQQQPRGHHPGQLLHPHTEHQVHSGHHSGQLFHPHTEHQVHSGHHPGQLLHPYTEHQVHLSVTPSRPTPSSTYRTSGTPQCTPSRFTPSSPYKTSGTT